MLSRLLLILLALVASPVLAQSAAQLENTLVELVSENQSAKAGDKVTLGIVLTPKESWHTYWEHPGDSGMPMRADWKLPTGALVQPFRYPVPETYIVAGLMNHVYSGRNVVLTDIQVPANATDNFPIQVRLDWLVCDDKLCVPEGADLSLTLPVGDGAADPTKQTLFADARAALPRSLAERATYQINGNIFRLEVPYANPQGVKAAHFFAAVDDAVQFAAPQKISFTENSLIIETDALANAQPASVSGLLRVERDGEIQGFTFDAALGQVSTGTPLKSVSKTSELTGFWTALGLAILGGLLLNLMPCVFPILSLKALSLAKSGQSASAARTEGLAYSFGVILITTALGLAAILLAQAGQGAGWAFQLQDPRVILFLALISFAIALNFAGLFEVNLGTPNSGQKLASQPGAKGAFFTGVLAAFVATPCTGPFMAGALGAALILPPAAGLGVFAGLGLGLALPFLAIGFIPALRRILPKPGTWMVTFRRILSVPMFLTAILLAWVLGRQTGVNGLTLGLVAALAFALALWVAGIRQQQLKSALVPMLLAGTVLLTSAAIANRFSSDAVVAPSAGPAGLAGSSFTPTALEQALQNREKLFLYFTADWCITCKVNEKGALSDPRVAEAFKQAGIQVMVGDWTKPDPTIARFLEEKGRAGIPLYLYYDPSGAITELPQLLTVDALLDIASKG